MLRWAAIALMLAAGAVLLLWLTGVVGLYVIVGGAVGSIAGLLVSLPLVRYKRRHESAKAHKRI